MKKENNLFRGVFTAMISPFKKHALDYEAVSALVEEQIDAGIHGLLVGGSTGESLSLSSEEYTQLLSHVSSVAGNKIKIIAGVPFASTKAVISHIRTLMEIDGISAFLVPSPYYLNPQQSGIIEHYQTICDASKAPIMAYNVPSRTGVKMDNDTILALMQMNGIVSIKDSSFNPDIPTFCGRVNADFPVLSGNDSLFLSYMVNGATGCISCLSNLLPNEVVELYNAYASGEYKKAQKLQSLLFPLMKAIFVEPNPVPLKYALSYASKIGTANVRLPLVEASQATKNLIQRLLMELKAEQKKNCENEEIIA